ncbi:MAG: hypothetical protein IKP40_01665 [Clostridia bacterium]|nr:hypothetical protein [Clostridia bacterium]
MKDRRLICVLLLTLTLCLLCPLSGLAEMQAFDPALTKAENRDAAAWTADETARAELAALLLRDWQARENALPEDAAPDFADCRLLAAKNVACVLFSAGDRVLALFYAFGADTANWDAAETTLTDVLAERLSLSMEAQVWPVDPALLQPQGE